MAVIVIVIVAVIGPLIVAALGTGTTSWRGPTPSTIRRSIRFGGIATMRSLEQVDASLDTCVGSGDRASGDQCVALSVPASATATASFPFTSAATITGALTHTATIT